MKLKRKNILQCVEKFVHAEKCEIENVVVLPHLCFFLTMFIKFTQELMRFLVAIILNPFLNLEKQADIKKT